MNEKYKKKLYVLCGPEEVRSKVLRNVAALPHHYTVLQGRGPRLESSLL